MLFNVRALPLQALSLLVIPMPWTLPRLFAIQLAVPCAIAEGQLRSSHFHHLPLPFPNDGLLSEVQPNRLCMGLLCFRFTDANLTAGLSGQAALDRSSQLMQNLGSSAYAWPFISIVVGLRIVDVLRNLLLASLPPRFWQEVIEVPVTLIALFGFAKLVIIRLQDLLPATAYHRAVNATSPPAEEGNTDDGLEPIVSPTMSM